MNNEFISFQNEEELCLIGFQLNSEKDEPEIYTLIIYGVKDRPLLYNGLILFFNRPELASDAIELSDPNLKNIYPFSQTVELVVDVANTLYLIQSENIDPTSTILNCINMFDDLVKATALSMPNQYKSILYSFADHLTFNREFSSFLDQEKISRLAIINALLWCIGAIVSKSKLLT